MTNKHTPAPWGAFKSELRTCGFEINANGINVATVSNYYSIKANNHKLIAAAPDLLEALIACNEAMEYMSEFDIPITLPQQVKDAIAKATQ